MDAFNSKRSIRCNNVKEKCWIICLANIANNYNKTKKKKKTVRGVHM